MMAGTVIRPCTRFSILVLALRLLGKAAVNVHFFNYVGIQKLCDFELGLLITPIWLWKLTTANDILVVGRPTVGHHRCAIEELEEGTSRFGLHGSLSNFMFHLSLVPVPIFGTFQILKGYNIRSGIGEPDLTLRVQRRHKCQNTMPRIDSKKYSSLTTDCTHLLVFYGFVEPNILKICDYTGLTITKMIRSKTMRVR
jgi:hypothetical protein